MPGSLCETSSETCHRGDDGRSQSCVVPKRRKLRGARKAKPCRGSIPHARLKERIEERISDGRLPDLLAGGLRQVIVHGLERWTPTTL